eukprot:4513965-Prymnesium_polylepis.1
MLARYGERVATQARVARASGKDSIWRAASSEGARRRGMQVLLDSLLLSRCDYLIKSNSAVSEFAIYFNPRLVDASYDFNIKDRAPP